MKAKVAEVFKSIQGEGPYAGIWQVFVRFYGCNLACSYCDTRLELFREMDVFELMSMVCKYDRYHSISLTGGEPLLQADFLKQFLPLARQDQQRIYLETNGILHQSLKEIISYVDVVAMDFKLPSSTGLACFWDEHRQFLKIAENKEVFVKVVIGEHTSQEDIEIAVSLIKECRKSCLLVLQPQYPLENALREKLDDFQAVCQSNDINVRVIGQLHKYLGVK